MAGYYAFASTASIAHRCANGLIPTVRNRAAYFLPVFEYMGALFWVFGFVLLAPLVVLFITTMGIVSVETLAQLRRYVIFGIVAAAALLTPPDVISQVLLAIPMIVLFEGALIVSKYAIRKRPTTTA